MDDPCYCDKVIVVCDRHAHEGEIEAAHSAATITEATLALAAGELVAEELLAELAGRHASNWEVINRGLSRMAAARRALLSLLDNKREGE